MADLRDAQGIREDHRAIVARLTEVEECASINTLREFMTKIQRLESMVSGEHGGVIGEAIRVCNRRIDHQQASLEDVRARIRTQDWYHELSDQEEDEEIQLSTRSANSENQSGVENRRVERRRRGLPPQLRFQRTMPRPSPPPTQDSTVQDTVQQAMQRFFDAYNQCVTRVTYTDDRLEQFRTAVRRDATELALTVQRTDQSVRQHRQDILQLNESLEDVQARQTNLDEHYRKVIEHEHHVNQVIDRNTHHKRPLFVR